MSGGAARPSPSPPPTPMAAPTYTVVSGSEAGQQVVDRQRRHAPSLPPWAAAGTVGFDCQACDPTSACSVARTTITIGGQPGARSPTRSRSRRPGDQSTSPSPQAAPTTVPPVRLPTPSTASRAAAAPRPVSPAASTATGRAPPATEGASTSRPLTESAVSLPATQCPDHGQRRGGGGDAVRPRSPSRLDLTPSGHVGDGDYTASTSGCPNPLKCSFWLLRRPAKWQVVADGASSSY